ncbi:hypothetical protein ACFOHK_08330 [Falsigemmobacter intermedius]|uniref:hypothetical protein n=2 Tax=Falsigemmobacter intermedius TaxID=1553448 RepID=UPI0035E636BB
MSDMSHHFESISITAVHGSAARQLWRAVAAHALADAAGEIARAKPERREVVTLAQLSYFRRADWHEVCNLAGVVPSIDRIEAFLRSDLISTSRSKIYRNLGLVMDRSPALEDA